MTIASNRVSFIIPHKGRFEMLIETLQSISEQDYPVDEIEVIVVSQTPELSHSELIENEKLALKIIIRPESETISTLRNWGVKHAAGCYLAFLDADISISNNWISSMINHLKNSDDRIIVSGTQVCDSNAPPLEHIRTSLASIEKDVELPFLPGCNLFLTLTDFERIGGFPEHLKTCEDYYFTDQATKFGKLYRTSDASYVHLGEDKEISVVFKKEIWRGQSNLQSICGRRIHLRELPSFVFPLGIYFSLIASLIALMFAAPFVSFIFFLLGVTPILAYSYRIYRLTNTASFSSIFKFYSVYFLARAIGTIVGIFKSIDAPERVAK